MNTRVNMLVIMIKEDNGLLGWTGIVLNRFIIILNNKSMNSNRFLFY
jgi:hypothetical protein